MSGIEEKQAPVALVTGASRGIGAAIALELAQRGYRVVGTATTAEGAQRIGAALSAHAGCSGAVLDVNDAPSVDALIDSVVKEQGGLQVLVNNAGITRDTLAMRMKDDEWETVINVNLAAAFRLSRACLKGMMKRRFGRIISITSVVGVTGNASRFVYGISDRKVGGLDVEMPDGNVATVFPSALSKNVPSPFHEEVTGGGGIRMHHKFVVIDFDKPTARVYLGSYNFSNPADVHNGENLFLFKDRRIVTAYMVEALRLFDHYHFRVISAAAKKTGKSLKEKRAVKKEKKDGKGTGLLRRGVHDFLRKHRQVREFHIASHEQGGEGATEVFL